MFNASMTIAGFDPELAQAMAGERLRQEELRIGTPAVTTRGFKEAEVRQLSHWIADVLDRLGDESVIERVRGQVLELCRRFPVYG